MVADHIPPESKCEGEGAGKVAHQLDGKEQGGKNPAPGCAHRIGHMGDVVHPVLPQAMKVIVEEDDHPADHGRVEVIRWRNKAWDQADQVGKENEQTQRRDERKVPLPFVATNDVSAQSCCHTEKGIEDRAEAEATRWNRSRLVGPSGCECTQGQKEDDEDRPVDVLSDHLRVVVSSPDLVV